jgi:hypothetical protein
MTSATRWFLLVVASSTAAVLAAFAATGDARSMVPLLWFLAVIPGLPYVRMVRTTREPVALWIAALGLSLAMDVLVAEVLLYTHRYTAATAVVVLAVLAGLGAAIGRVREGDRSEPAEAANVTAKRPHETLV